MLWALENKREFDVFIVYTDSETLASKVHPSQALKQYRQQTGITDARSVSLAAFLLLRDGLVVCVSASHAVGREFMPQPCAQPKNLKWISVDNMQVAPVSI